MSQAIEAPKTFMQKISRRGRAGGEQSSAPGDHFSDPDRHRDCAFARVAITGTSVSSRSSRSPRAQGRNVNRPRRCVRYGHNGDVSDDRRESVQDRNPNHRRQKSADDRGHSLHVLVAHPQLHGLHRGGADDRGDGRRRRGRGIRTGERADSQARDRLAALGPDLHPGVRRHRVEHRRRCRLPGADSAGRRRHS